MDFANVLGLGDDAKMCKADFHWGSVGDVAHERMLWSLLSSRITSCVVLEGGECDFDREE